jgi:predicted AlkP superfamily pyrophosphatase or phosphodiesterase
LALVTACLAFIARRGDAQDRAKPLLVMLSIDGMRPDYITAADAHGVKAPNLRRIMQEGSYADGVQGVIPTVTFPSHTTLVTGVWPAKHGILNNTTFDPLGKNQGGWYWYAEDLRVPTLWDAAAKAGLTTAAVRWPVTVGARITYNVPEIWRAETPEDEKLIRAVATPGLMQEAEKEIGPYSDGFDLPWAKADEIRAHYGRWILEKKHPNILFLHLISLDDAQHDSGPFSAESVTTLESVDMLVGQVRETAEHLAPGRAYLAVVSDHGFSKIDTQLNLLAAFRQAGLLMVDDKGKITDWKATIWNAGVGAVVLKDPSDTKILSSVRDLLNKLASNPGNGIDRILDAAELHERGGFPQASFLVAIKPGWRIGSSLDGPLLSQFKPGGNHGFMPDLPDMRASFFIVGPGIPKGKSLGVIDMRDVAPTLAHLAGLSLPNAEGRNLLP